MILHRNLSFLHVTSMDEKLKKHEVSASGLSAGYVDSENCHFMVAEHIEFKFQINIAMKCGYLWHLHTNY